MSGSEPTQPSSSARCATASLDYIERIERAVVRGKGDDASVPAVLGWYADRQLHDRWTVRDCLASAESAAARREHERKGERDGG